MTAQTIVTVELPEPMFSSLVAFQLCLARFYPVFGDF